MSAYDYDAADACSEAGELDGQALEHQMPDDKKTRGAIAEMLRNGDSLDELQEDFRRLTFDVAQAALVFTRVEAA